MFSISNSRLLMIEPSDTIITVKMPLNFFSVAQHKIKFSVYEILESKTLIFSVSMHEYLNSHHI